MKNVRGETWAVIFSVAISIGCAEFGSLADPSNLIVQPPEDEDTVTEPDDDLDPEPVAAPCVEGDARVEGADGSCYFAFGQTVTFSAAQLGCGALGAELVQIDSDVENTLVASITPGISALPDFWIGANDRITEGTFVWAGTLSPLTFTRWRAGEPNNVGDEDCAVMESDTLTYTWDDRQCTAVQPYICERPPGVLL
jgi:hypothetical protein